MNIELIKHKAIIKGLFGEVDKLRFQVTNKIWEEGIQYEKTALDYLEKINKCRTYLNNMEYLLEEIQRMNELR